MTAGRRHARWARIVRDPLVHFLVGGLLVFLFFAVRDAASPASTDIVISPQLQTELVDQWQKAQGNTPDAGERKKIIEQWVREEILYREALHLGFDRDDVVIRRRLANKMEFFLETAIADPQPSRQQLEQWLRTHADRYRRPQRIDFQQLWFPDEAGARAALDRIRAGVRWQALGREISLPDTLQDQDPEQILKRFGDRFSRGIAAVAADGRWHGPIISSFGFHLVHVSKRSPGRLPPLDAVRDEVATDWRDAERGRKLHNAYAAYRDQYHVVMPR